MQQQQHEQEQHQQDNFATIGSAWEGSSQNFASMGGMEN